METQTTSPQVLYGAWVSPRGAYFPVKDECSHEGIAIEITGGLMPEIEDCLPESSYLLASGWMRIVFSKVPCFQGQNFTRHQKEWIESTPDSYIGEAETWGEFTKRSEEVYKFSPIYPFGEKEIKMNVTIDKIILA